MPRLIFLRPVGAVCTGRYHRSRHGRPRRALIEQLSTESSPLGVEARECDRHHEADHTGSRSGGLPAARGGLCVAYVVLIIQQPIVVVCRRELHGDPRGQCVLPTPSADARRDPERGVGEAAAETTAHPQAGVPLHPKRNKGGAVRPVTSVTHAHGAGSRPRDDHTAHARDAQAVRTHSRSQFTIDCTSHAQWRLSTRRFTHIISHSTPHGRSHT